MAIKKSIVLTAILPESETNLELFDKGVSLLKKRGISVIEYYTPVHFLSKIENILQEKKIKGIYLAAIFQKRQKLNLSSLDENKRRRAINETLKCIDVSKEGGSSTVLVLGGSKPKEELQNERAFLALQDSLEKICNYAGRDITITFEPGDSHVEYYQLIGPTELAVKLIQQMNSRGINNIVLTMDISHIAMLGEEITVSLKKAIPYCHHIHLANCILDQNNPLYGDKHPPFGVKASQYSVTTARGVMEWLEKNYPNKDFIVSLEIISRAQDQWKFLDEMIQENSWFFDY